MKHEATMSTIDIIIYRWQPWFFIKIVIQLGIISLGGNYMSGFKLYCNNSLWQFSIIPSNNNKQPMGFSICYNSKEDCKKAVYSFKKFVSDNLIATANSPFVKIEKENEKFVYIYFDETNNLLFKSRELESKQNAKKAINSIYTNYINKPLLCD